MHKGIPHLHSRTPAADSSDVVLANKTAFSLSVNLENEFSAPLEVFGEACLLSF